jgi:hypothetical protein
VRGVILFVASEPSRGHFRLAWSLNAFGLVLGVSK